MAGQVGMEAQAGGNIGQRTDGQQDHLAAVADGLFIDQFPRRTGIGLLSDFCKLYSADTGGTVGIGGIVVPGVIEGLLGTEGHRAIHAQPFTDAQCIAAGQFGRDIALDGGDGHNVQQFAGIGQRQRKAVVYTGIAVDDDGDLFHSGNLRSCILPLSYKKAPAEASAFGNI